MPQRQLDVGTLVSMCKASRERDAQLMPYRIEQLLAAASGEILYKIRCDAEPFDRIVSETDLIQS